ncbi:hypothetical protein AB4472_11625 [Vibrio lentus]
MKKIICAAVVSIALIGCSDDSNSNSNSNIELSEQFEGLYLNESAGIVNSAVISNDDQGDFLLIDFASKTSFVPSPFSETTNSIDYNQFKEGTSGSWINNTGSFKVSFSGMIANSDQLGVDLNKSSSDPLGSISPTWNVIGSNFSFTSDNGNTYSGTLEFDSSGYWELDDDFPFTDSSGNLVSSTAEIIVFVRSGKTYSIIYDKQFSRVIDIDIR